MVLFSCWTPGLAKPVASMRSSPASTTFQKVEALLSSQKASTLRPVIRMSGWRKSLLP
jgi:hypothetical protein